VLYSAGNADLLTSPQQLYRGQFCARATKTKSLRIFFHRILGKAPEFSALRCLGAARLAKRA
jgi:hypothetical protein